MKPYQPVRWPCYIWWKDELKPRRKYLLFGPRNQGERTASNYLGFLIVAKKGTPSWTIEQEKYECRYWVTHFWRLVDFVWFYKRAKMLRLFSLFHIYRYPNRRVTKAAAHLSRVEAASRAQEIRAKGHYQNVPRGMYVSFAGGDLWADPWFDSQAREYARSIHRAKNYPFIKAAGWTEDDCYNEIVKHL